MVKADIPDFIKEINDIKEELLSDLNPEDIKRYSDLDLFYGDDQLAKDIIKNKYFAPWETCPLDMWLRIAWGAASIEKDRVYWAKQFLKILIDFFFVPAGRINYGLGRQDIEVSFSNCYVLPIKEDSIDAIYNCLKEQALTFKSGGGCGTSLNLRPRGSPIKKTGGNSCGNCGFMELFSISTATIAQQNRRGASILCMDVSHPDIEEFISIKNDVAESIKALQSLQSKYPEGAAEYKILKDQIEKKRAVQYANISVKLSDEFLNAVESDSNFNLAWNNKVYKTVKAKALWDKIIESAWSSAEPGIIFWDRMKETNNLEYVNPIIATNPCSEIPLGAYGNCLLGHINLKCFVKDNVFDFSLFEYYINIAMRFLDNVCTLNDGKHPLKEQNDVARNERRTGLGITGLGDALILLGLKYGSLESIRFINKMMEIFRNSAYSASCDLAEERGSFPWFNEEGFFSSKFAQSLPEIIKLRISQKGIRNGMLLTTAPVGTGSVIAQSSSGCEPIFRISFTRKVKNPDGFTSREYRVYHPLIQSKFNDLNNLPDYVVDSSQIDPIDRVKVQATIQKYIDNSISSTVNLTKDATVEDVKNIYMTAWKLGCKGITVYREGSREGVLISDDIKQQITQKEKRLVPKRPVKLSGETYKLKIDITGEKPYNCYVTVNFDEGTKKPHEILVTETNANKQFKDIMAFETTTRLISLALRHDIPIKFIIEQLEKVNCQYIYSLPISIANILRNYLEFEDEEGECVGEKCSSCGENSIKRENGCILCSSCGYSKCS